MHLGHPTLPRNTLVSKTSTNCRIPVPRSVKVFPQKFFPGVGEWVVDGLEAGQILVSL